MPDLKVHDHYRTMTRQEVVAKLHRLAAQLESLTTRANAWRMREKMSSPDAVGGWWTSALGDCYVEFSEVVPRTIRTDCLGQMSGDRDRDKPPLRAGGTNQ